MSTFSISETFTITHARNIAAKVATDLLRLQRFYGEPSNEWINKFETEVVELLKAGYLETVTYGFRKNGEWIEPTLRYTSKDFAGNGPDDDPGKIRPGADTTGALFHSFLTYTSSWHNLAESARTAFRSGLPFQRSTGSEPSVNGYFSQDLTYSSGGRALSRAVVRNF